ncbi:23S rRNA (pseudouridine1915-N3)-methyltransferase [Mesorhizobium albiziae]|uniref:Ribosomal RNA large subunit methyltransferase H n=1 Tax=Neomesorhizobium albiziae TaxID=335020 RepID=A0A1I3XIW6_9HYPH|nr:23S rRNA (pseudouridine(1915)-N(3))-methyltransferase RlmH [Mesorhizobium albiziae]GLS30411.1 ribosomal RNA large subunit methyltransferase H [Mesorhizobium albiziae]SFK19400.1 23S rRNA (pseudouridine1915-N3)-methyltransferase [Mesorhizobium albiziae]
MKIAVHAVGRMKAGPEKELADRYFDRFAKSGPAIGLEFSGVGEFPESRAQGVAERRREEAQKLQAQLAPGAVLFLLDERGKNISSEQFSERIAGFRDSGQRNLAIAIGGPDGHDPALHQAATLVLSFGALTWPHQLVRIMLAEQLYRTATILSGHPYHRA